MNRSAKLVIGGFSVAVLLTAIASVAGAIVVRRALWWEPTPEQCLGFPLPAGSRVVAETGTISHVGERFFVVEMTRDQFDQFRTAGGLTHRADLVEYWPGSLDAPPGFPWMAHPINDEFTVYRQANDALDVARWEDGRLYFRHHVP